MPLDHRLKPSCDQIINLLRDPFVVIDNSYHIIAANKAYCEHYAVEHGTVEGRLCYEVSHHSDKPCAQQGEHCPMETVFGKAQSAQMMHVHFDKNGREEHVQIQANPLYDAEGNVIYMGEYIYPQSKPNEEENALIGRSPALRRLKSVLQRVAPTQTTVLLQGESGSGKECVAEYLHAFSNYSQGPFVIVDCGTLGESLIESELFGHEKGSFTGANARKKGLFEAAHGGTLFIDEIGELPLALQTKLLRVLETGTIRRIGGTEYVKANVRVIAASNRDLKQMAETKAFRADLYYRLSAFPIRIPALRERKDDIAAIAEHFLTQMEDGDIHVPLAPEVIETLLTHDYPGNVRELRNIVERAAILACDEVMRDEHVVFETDSAIDSEFDGRLVREAPEETLLSRRRGRFSKDQIVEALKRTAGHRAQAANLLGISERTLYRYVQRLRLQLS